MRGTLARRTRPPSAFPWRYGTVCSRQHHTTRRSATRCRYACRTRSTLTPRPQLCSVHGRHGQCLQRLRGGFPVDWSSAAGLQEVVLVCTMTGNERATTRGSLFTHGAVTLPIGRHAGRPRLGHADTPTPCDTRLSGSSQHPVLTTSLAAGQVPQRRGTAFARVRSAVRALGKEFDSSSS